jgi:hypothetical protein
MRDPALQLHVVELDAFHGRLRRRAGDPAKQLQRRRPDD